MKNKERNRLIGFTVIILIVTTNLFLTLLCFKNKTNINNKICVETIKITDSITNMEETEHIELYTEKETTQKEPTMDEATQKRIDEQTYIGKNKNDVQALKKIIEEQLKNGAIISDNLNNRSQYKWDEKTGRLIGLTWCYKNLTGNLDLKQLNCLEKIELFGNNLERVDLSGLKKLKELQCLGSNIKELNISGLESLETLKCDNNQLEKLDVRDSPKLMELECTNNEIRELDLRNLKELYYLRCNNNKLVKLEIDKEGFSDGSFIECSNNQLTELKLYENDMFLLDCSNNKLKELDVTGLYGLEYLICENNELTELKVKNASLYLEEIECKGNNLTQIDITGLDSLRIVKSDPGVSLKILTYIIETDNSTMSDPTILVSVDSELKEYCDAPRNKNFIMENESILGNHYVIGTIEDVCVRTYRVLVP